MRVAFASWQGDDKLFGGLSPPIFASDCLEIPDLPETPLFSEPLGGVSVSMDTREDDAGDEKAEPPVVRTILDYYTAFLSGKLPEIWPLPDEPKMRFGRSIVPIDKRPPIWPDPNMFLHIRVVPNTKGPIDYRLKISSPKDIFASVGSILWDLNNEGAITTGYKPTGRNCTSAHAAIWLLLTEFNPSYTLDEDELGQVQGKLRREGYTVFVVR